MEYEATQTYTNKRWACILHVLVLSTILGQDVISIYPLVPFTYRPVLHAVIHPLHGHYDSTGRYQNKNSHPVIVIWTRDGNLSSESGAIYKPNHVAPIININDRQTGKILKRRSKCAPICGRQAKISKFFTNKGPAVVSSPLKEPTLLDKPDVPLSSAGVPLPSPDVTVAHTVQVLPPVDQDVALPSKSLSNELQPSDTAKPSVSVSLDSQQSHTQSTKSNRSFKSVWLLEFPWLTIEDGKTYKCKDCAAAKKKNIFAIGKTVDNPKKDDFTKHQKGLDHRQVKNIPKLMKDMKRATVKAHDSVKGAIIAQMATVLTQAQEAIPSSKNTSLIKLQMFNVSYFLWAYLRSVKSLSLQENTSEITCSFKNICYFFHRLL